MMVPKRRYLSYLTERWWLVLVSLVIALVPLLFYETVRPESFSSFAQIYLSGDVQINNASIFTEESLTYFGTQIELLKSARLQGAAFERAGITLRLDEKNPYKIEIVQPMKTSILQLQATGPDPVLTQRFLQSLIDDYLAYKKETRLSTSKDVLDSLREELAKKAEDLQVEQGKWGDFAKSNNIAVLEEESRSAGMYLADLNLQLAKLKLELGLLRNGIEALPVSEATNVATISGQPTNAAATEATLNPLLFGSDVSLKSARVELGLRRVERAQLLKERGEVAARRLENGILRLEQTVAILEEQNRAQKKLDLQELEKRVLAVEAAIPAWEIKVLDINNRLAQSQQLKANIQRAQGYYDHLLATLQNVDLSKNVQQERLSVLQPATRSQPEKRNLVIRIVLAAVFGVFLGLAGAFGWYLLDDRFVSVRDIKDQYGESILGLVPQIKVVRAKPESALLADSDSRHGYLESYRHLRSALLLSSFGESRPQTLLFTSASAAEGKTTIAINLARLLARSGLRVVLVDADARGSGMKQLLGDANQVGVLDYLRGEADAKAVLHPTELAGLSLVPCGTHNEQSEGLFLRPKLAELIQTLRQNADFVILDSAPILASDAAALLVPHADAVVLVTRPFYTRSGLVRQALDMLYQRQAKHVRIVLNRARADDLADPARAAKI